MKISTLNELGPRWANATKVCALERWPIKTTAHLPLTEITAGVTGADGRAPSH